MASTANISRPCKANFIVSHDNKGPQPPFPSPLPNNVAEHVGSSGSPFPATLRGRGSYCGRARRGTSVIEVVVAFSLLATVLSVAATLVIRHDRLLTSQRHYRLALDELSNQLDRLTALSDADRLEALEQLSPSPFARARLPGVDLQYTATPEEMGERLTLRITWDETQRRAAPVSMTGWIHPAMAVSDKPALEDPSS